MTIWLSASEHPQNQTTLSNVNRDGFVSNVTSCRPARKVNDRISRATVYSVNFKMFSRLLSSLLINPVIRSVTRRRGNRSNPAAARSWFSFA
jgi:hypothetical protein